MVKRIKYKASKTRDELVSVKTIKSKLGASYIVKLSNDYTEYRIVNLSNGKIVKSGTGTKNNLTRKVKRDLIRLGVEFDLELRG